MCAEATTSRNIKPPPLEDLLRAWGLHRAPFAADDKSADLFASDTHHEVIGLLDTTAALRGIMMLTGKSTLIKSWLTELEPVTLLLVLDDAQNYPGAALEELRLLLGIGGRKRPAFAMVLLGDDYLLGSLRLSVQRALFTRISAAARLAELPRESIPAYLNWQMARAGLDRDAFLSTASDLLAEASESNPRILGLLAQAAWHAAATKNSHTIESDHVHSALRQVPAAGLKIKTLEPKAGSARGPHGPPALPALYQRTPARIVKNPAPILKKSNQSPPFILKKSPAIIVTRNKRTRVAADRIENGKTFTMFKSV